MLGSRRACCFLPGAGLNIVHAASKWLTASTCPPQVISAELDYKFACTGYAVRQFVTEALESMSLGGSMAAAKAEIMAALDEAEKAGGGELDSANEKGWQVLTAKLGEIEKKYGLADKGKVREEAIFEMYKQHINQLRTTVGGLRV